MENNATYCGTHGRHLWKGEPGSRICQRCSISHWLDRPMADRFWTKVNKNGPIVRKELGPCWLWIGGTICKGRKGIFLWYGYPTLAHCVAWMLSKATKTIDVPCICHKCDVQMCVRPDHLFEGTQKDNMNDMLLKGRRWCRLDPTNIPMVRARFLKGETAKQLAQEYKVSVATIHRALNGTTWKTHPLNEG